MTRCPCCGARGLRPSDRSSGLGAAGFSECGHCGILVDPRLSGAGAGAGTLERFLKDRLAPDRFASRTCDPIVVESYALRTLALGRNLATTPLGDAQRDALHHPYRPLPAIARLSPLSLIDPVPVSLVMLCRLSDLEGLALRLPALGPSFAEIVLVVSASAVPPRPLPGGDVRVLARPLEGDFAAQRNAGQIAAKSDWVLQLDADESLDDDTLAHLGRVAALADGTGALSVGLPRRNLVDGVLADLYPDVQYRLNRRSVRFEGRVHERPLLPRGWRDGFIAPNLRITHHLTRSHVETRSARYEELSPGKGRTFELQALLTPWRP